MSLGFAAGGLGEVDACVELFLGDLVRDIVEFY